MLRKLFSIWSRILILMSQLVLITKYQSYNLSWGSLPSLPKSWHKTVNPKWLSNIPSSLEVLSRPMYLLDLLTSGKLICSVYCNLCFVEIRFSFCTFFSSNTRSIGTRAKFNLPLFLEIRISWGLDLASACLGLSICQAEYHHCLLLLLYHLQNRSFRPK